MSQKSKLCYFPSKCLDAQQAHHYAPNFFFLLSNWLIPLLTRELVIGGPRNCGDSLTEDRRHIRENY